MSFDNCYDQCHAALTKENKFDEETKQFTCYKKCMRYRTKEEKARDRKAMNALANLVAKFQRMLNSAN
ncbi:unnamed protein product [Cylicocyclus nassatus]|uniref:Uncharacterized protein n=1 Tax=Cylicocyclus nassatus TaxID=53992 RepID=A0AA36DIX2_CYLNA|nr:unnamed protein product [Cylicocyclus nassatus]CAJ0588467.1 unnamed protein product [Cylicocyclus nassatus]